MQTLLTVAYDGTNYAGWQRQANGIAVQQILESALSKLLSSKVTVRAASRTDAGVHAIGQRAAFRHEGFKIPLEKFPLAVNSFLPKDISVTDAVNVPDGFNPRHAERKTYRYQIYNAPCPNPLICRYGAFVPRALDIEAMKKAARFIIGRHDFKSFCAAGGTGSGEHESTVREVFECAVTREADNGGGFPPGEPRGGFAGKSYNGLITLTVTGNAFLYNMVRIIAGTVLYAGLGKISPEDVPGIIEARDRTLAGKTMPPEGLTLMEVKYITL